MGCWCAGGAALLGCVVGRRTPRAGRGYGKVKLTAAV